MCSSDLSPRTSTTSSLPRLAVVGSERAGDSTWYWFEVSFAGKDPGKSGVVQILTGSLASGLESPRALVF